MRKTIYTDEHAYIVNRLIEARKEAGLEQKAVAKMLNVYPTCLCKIEAGQRKVDIVDLMEFSKIYKKRLLYFVEKYIEAQKEYEYLKGLLNSKKSF
ncbi:MAG: helix-turn-helix transcriptional regulator [Elusimicrobiota bacterium]